MPIHVVGPDDDDKGQLNPADIGWTMAKYATQVIR